MSDDELEKLAAEMQNMKASETARERGMAVAMAAFDAEFVVETVKDAVQVSEESTANEKISTPTQGLANAPRPTGQTTRDWRVQTSGRDMMTRISNVMNNFKFTPRAAMMGGSCMAALLFSMVFYNADQFGNAPINTDSTKAIEVVEPLAVEPVIEAPTLGRAKERADAKSSTMPETPVTESPKTEASAAEVTPSATISTPTEPDVTVAIAPVIETPSISDATRTSDVEPVLPSDIVVIERRRIKTPARTQERVVPNVTRTQTRRVIKKTGIPTGRTLPAITKEVTRRVVKTPASTQERTIPAITKEVTGRVKQDDGSFKIVTATVVLQEASTESVTIPKTFETVTETVVVQPAGPEYEPGTAEYETVAESFAVQEASTELVTIPATYETVSETIRIGADGSTTVLSSETVGSSEAVASAPAKAPKPQAQALPTPPQISRLSASRKGNQQAALSRQAGVALPRNRAPSSSPLPQKIGGLTLEVVPSEPVATGRVNANTHQQFTVFNGVSNQVVESTQTTVNQTGEILARVLMPAKYKTVTKQVLVSPARTEKVIIPAETKDIMVKLANDDGTFREVVNKVVIKPEHIDYVITPAKYETRSERVLIEPAREEWKPGSQAINAGVVNTIPAPPKYILRDDDGNVVREFENRDAFEIYKANLPTPVAEKPVSTFSVDVDTASYSFMRASLNRGQLPPRASIRLEEMINYFPYDYEAPTSADEPFKANVTVTPTPWNADTKLMHIGIKGYVPPKAERPRSNIVFLIDTSGSMNQANKLPLLINSFKLLLGTLDADDTVSIVTYAGRAGTVLEPTPASDKHKIKEALTRLRAGGSTAGAAGLELAYQKAQESFDDEGNNRVILATDGDFNVGFSSHEDMKAFITKKRETGIFLSVLGFGQGNYNDQLMQALAQNGNGVAAYIDNLAEAQKVLANEAGGALYTIAKDVKIQVEFNPATVAEYRLIGYETRALKRQDFNNDKVDAGEIGAGHTVTAIYEMTPVGSPAVTVDKLRYASETLPTDTGSDEFAFVKIRHKLPNADTSTLQMFPIGKGLERRIKRASDDMRFATAVAIVGQKLRGDIAVEDYSYKDAIKLAKRAKGKDENGYRAEFIQLIRLAKDLEEASSVQETSQRHRR